MPIHAVRTLVHVMDERIVAKLSSSVLRHDPATRAAVEPAPTVGLSAGACGGAKVVPPQSEAAAARRGASGAA